MSWNNVIPWYIYELEQERREAKMLCAFEEEFLSARTRSTPDHWYTIDEWKRDDNEVKLASLGVRL